MRDWLLGFRRSDGIFRIPGMADDEVFKKPDPAETWRYIDWHVTNYTLGAIHAVAPEEMPVLDFAVPFLVPTILKAWLADRDLRDPWLEGNNIVNLGSFLFALRASAPAEVERALDILFTWHDYHRNPATGFWGVGQSSDPQRLLHAFAGSMHNFHLWYETGRPIPYHARVIDYVLAQPTAASSACIDVDQVDLLVHGIERTGHREAEARMWLTSKLRALVALQELDGGFADERTGIRRQDGWVRGYGEPQGLSNTFATWFRWIAIAMAADRLFPGLRGWHFRRMVGIGYRRRPA